MPENLPLPWEQCRTWSLAEWRGTDVARDGRVRGKVSQFSSCRSNLRLSLPKRLSLPQHAAAFPLHRGEGRRIPELADV